MLRAWLRGRFELVTSQEQLHELARVLRYRRIRNVIDREQARGFLENIDVLAIMATNLPEVDVSPDPASQRTRRLKNGSLLLWRRPSGLRGKAKALPHECLHSRVLNSNPPASTVPIS